jgi:RimJ/RimL family protein N-acetyltransferase
VCHQCCQLIRAQRRVGGAAGSALCAVSALFAAHAEDGAQEATRWIVDYGFKQLGLHRISLHVLADNPHAVALYKEMWAA